jgi:hypothetical protein
MRVRRQSWTGRFVDFVPRLDGEDGRRAEPTHNDMIMMV